MQNPFEMLEEYKKRMATIERLDDNTPPGKVIYTDDVLLQRNIEIYEKLKESGKIPGMCTPHGHHQPLFVSCAAP